MRGIGRWRNDSRRPLPVDGDAVLARARQVVEVGARACRPRSPWSPGSACPRRRSPSVPHSPGMRAVVVGGHERLGEPLAEPARVDAGALLHGVGLEPVADGLVEQHAAEAVAHHDRHAAAGRATRVEHRRRALRAASSATSLGVVREQLEAGVTAERLVPGLDAAAAPGHHLDAEPHARAVVAGVSALRVEDLRRGGASRRSRRSPAPPRARAARALVALAQQLGLALGVDLLGALRDRCTPSRRLDARGQRLRLAPLAATPPGDTDSATRWRSCLREAVDVAEVGRVAHDHAHRGAAARCRSAGARRAGRRAPARGRSAPRRRARRSRRRGERALQHVGRRARGRSVIFLRSVLGRSSGADHVAIGRASRAGSSAARRALGPIVRGLARGVVDARTRGSRPRWRRR